MHGAAGLVLAVATTDLLADISHALSFALAPRRLNERISKLLEALNLLKVDRPRTVAVLAETNDTVIADAAQIRELPHVLPGATSEESSRMLRVRAQLEEVLGVARRALPRLRSLICVASIVTLVSEAGLVQLLSLAPQERAGLVALARPRRSPINHDGSLVR